MANGFVGLSYSYLCRNILRLENRSGETRAATLGSLHLEKGSRSGYLPTATKAPRCLCVLSSLRMPQDTPKDATRGKNPLGTGTRVFTLLL